MEGRLRLLTLNLGLPSVSLGQRRRLPLAELAHRRLTAAPAQLRALNADIISLQEVFHITDQSYLVAALKQDYPYHCALRGTKSAIGNGLLYLSRYPLTECALTIHKTAMASPLQKEAAFLSVTAQLTDLPNLRLLALHLTAAGPFSNPQSEAELKRRRRELEALLASPGASDSVLLGDFNASPHVCPEIYSEIIERGYYDAFIEAGCADGAHAATWERENYFNRRSLYRNAPSQRIDHVFLPDSLAKTWTVVSAQIALRDPVGLHGNEAFTLSDHFGMLVDLRLHPEMAA